MSAPTPLSSEHDLVRFAEAPVSEVALTAQFAREVVGLEVLADFGRSVRDQFPQREQQPPLPPMEESFDSPPTVPTFQIQFASPAALPRTWFLTKDGTRLIQVQGDRISLNWRRMSEEHEYPRYSQLRLSLQEYLGRLYDCVRASGSEEPRINVVEITYVNPVGVPGIDGGTHPDLARIINRVRPGPPGSFLQAPEDAQLQARWRIPGEELGAAGPVGRLHLAASPALKPPAATPIYMVNLTARVLPLAGDPAAAWAAMDLGHRWVALGFDDLTTSEMHALWKRQERS